MQWPLHLYRWAKHLSLILGEPNNLFPLRRDYTSMVLVLDCIL